MHQSKPEPKTVLLTRFSALGDVVMTVPVVYSACALYPDHRFVMVTRPAMTAVFACPPPNLEIVGVDLREKYAGIAGIRRLAADLVSTYSPDICIDLHNVLRTRLLSLFLRASGIRSVHIFKPRAKRRALTRRHNKVMLPLTSQRARYREAFYKAGLPINECFDGLYGGHAKAPAEAFAAITPPRPEGQHWVGIAPFAAHEGKIYPPELMEKVVARLQADADDGTDLRIFLFGGGAREVEILGAWAERYPCVTSLAGKRYGIGAELALINHLDAMVTMDSANMHLASIVSTPTISIWGATHPYCGFRGWHQTEADTVQLPLPCRPCSVFGQKPCYRGDLLCLNGIRPDRIYARIKEKIS